jgi:1-acyl-sn-glycerol-3-phosphate acyltransferase
MSAHAEQATRSKPSSDIHPIRRTIRYYVARLVVAVLARCWLRFEVDGLERLPRSPAIYAFNHLSWIDPFVLMATLPLRPRLSFFGPREEDMRAGGRNRLMLWTGSAIPYKPGKNDLLDATRRVGAVISAGGIVAIAGEGRIGAIEQRLLPLNDGPAYFALRSRVPLVPIAINGTTWLRFGAQVRVRIGEPIVGEGRPDRAAVEAMSGVLRERLEAMLADAPTPDRTGRVAGWMTERFNEWPEGSRLAALEAQRGTIDRAAADAANVEDDASTF